MSALNSYKETNEHRYYITSHANKSALNLLKNEHSAKVGVRTKRLKAGWDNKYLLKVITTGFKSFTLVLEIGLNL